MFRRAYIQFILVFVVLFSSISFLADAKMCKTHNIDDKYEIHFFYSYKCPHCHDEIEFLEQIKKTFPQINIHYYEILKPENKKNKELFKEFAARYNTSTKGVPKTFIMGNVFIGFDKGEGEVIYSQAYEAQIGYANLLWEQIDFLATKLKLQQQAEIKIIDNVISLQVFFVFLLPLIYLASYFFARKKMSQNPQYRRYWISGLAVSIIIAIFVFLMFVPDAIISSFAASLPFPFLVIVIALADGFNPCAFTVLFILLSLLTYTRSKKEMNIIGLVFIITSALMYFLFIMAMIWIGSFFIERYGTIILTILGIIILIAGIINLKDYLFFRKGVSLTVSDKEKQKITFKVKQIVDKLKQSDSFGAMLFAIGATIILAIGVNIVELGCTAILPTVYMSALLSKYGLSVSMVHIIWTIVYGFIYIIPLLIILVNFIFTFKSDRITENQGRILKLVAGLFMVICGLIMLIKPELLMFR